MLQCAAGHVHQALRGERLFHEVVGAFLHRADGHGDVAVPGDQHHRQAAVALLESCQQFQAIDARQANVADDDAGEVVADPLQGFFGAAHANAGNVFQGQRLLAAEQHMGVVFDDQYTKVVVHIGSAGVGLTNGKLRTNAVPPLAGCSTPR
ncbi:hypothetical protein D3C71_1268820 [compost metagenome]